MNDDVPDAPYAPPLVSVSTFTARVFGSEVLRFPTPLPPPERDER